MIRVSLEPTIISVLMSARAGSALAALYNNPFIRAPSRTGKNDRRRTGLEAAQQCEGVVDLVRPCGRGGIIQRDHEIGACREREPFFHQGPGLGLSDREIAQKSFPKGAPTRAAAACMAETPGLTATSMSRQAGSP